MKKVTTRRREDQEDGSSNSIFDQFNNRTDLPQDEDENKDNKTINVQDLYKQIADLGQRVDLAEKTNMALMSQPIIPQQTYQAPIKVQEEQAPDPTMDPVGYKKYVEGAAQKTINDFLATQRQEQDRANTEKSQADQVWSAFSNKYEDYSEDQDRVEYVAGLVLKEAKSLGIDPKKYMTSAQDKFFSDVTTKYDKIFGKPGEEDDDTHVETTGGTRRVPGADVSRTAGIFGGMESSGRPNKGADAPSDFVKELQANQMKNGFY